MNMGPNADEMVQTPVPNVQEMVRRDPSKVPERFILNNEDRPKTTDNPLLSSSIPVIDLSLLSKGQEEELQKLDLACKNWGFFQVVNHGVEKEVLKSMKDAAGRFFELPLEEKNKYSVDFKEIQGYGLPYSIPVGLKLDWSDPLVLHVYPSHQRKLKFWPTQPKEFKEMVEAYSSGVRKVAEEILGSLSLIMGMERDAFIGLHKELVQTLRVNYCSPCIKPDEVLSISPHSDTSTITILLQDDDLCALQIRHDSEWVPVLPIPNALVVNVGDILEIWSNGKYKSIVHRAVTNKERARISFASFVYPLEDVEIEPFDHMVDSQQPSKYKKVMYGDYLRQAVKSKFRGKSHTEINGQD